MRPLIRALLIAGVTLCASGCATKVIFVDPNRDVLRLDDDVRGHVFYQKDGHWIRSEHPVKLPAGWYAGYLQAQ